MEIPAILKESGILKEKRNPLRILDISSPQMLSITLANFSSCWDIYYVNPFQEETNEMIKLKSYMRLRNINVLNRDITEPSIQELGEFDYIFSCSVLEHIYPERGGDVQAAKNLLPMLKNKGILTISVPFYKKGFNEYKDEDIYHIKNPNKDKMFFQRFYDEDMLKNQIIIPSKLKLAKQLYAGERFFFPNDIHKRLGALIQGKFIGLFFGKIFFILSGFFMELKRDYRELKKPYIAIITLINE
jgi:hypothetical protein